MQTSEDSRPAREFGDANNMQDHQPISLMTIERHRTSCPSTTSQRPNSNDLLTLRILEASERKMQLIKRLLTPEEFESVKSELFGGDSSDQLAGTEAKVGEKAAIRNDITSVPLHLDASKAITSTTILKCKSENNLHLSPPRDLHASLARKRKAIEFFFTDEPAEQPQNRGDLAIELRSGFYVSSSVETESKVLREIQFGFFDRLSAMFDLAGISIWKTSVPLEEDEFVKQHKQLGCKPYSSVRNLMQMRTRLQADGQLDKVSVDQSSLRDHRPIESTKQCKILNRTSSLDSFKLVLLNETQDLMQLARAYRFCPLERPQLLAYHPLIDQMCEGLLRKGKRLRKLPGEVPRSSIGVAGLLELNFECLTVVTHELLLEEERLAARLSDISRKVGDLRRIHAEVADNLVKLLANKAYDRRGLEGASSLIGRLQKLTNMHRQVQFQGRGFYAEIQAQRDKQEFSATSVELVEVANIDSNVNLELKIAEFVQGVNTLSLDHQTKSIIDRISLDSKALELGESFEIKEIRSQVGTNLEYSPEEIQRRLRLRQWRDSLVVRIILPDSHYFDCLPATNSNLFELDLTASSLTFPTSSSETEVQLSVVVSAFKWHRKLQIRSPLASAKEKIECDGSSAHCVSLQLVDNSEVQLVFSAKFRETASVGAPSRAKQDRLVDILYRRAFRLEHSFDNTDTKLHRLQSQPILAQLFALEDFAYFQLDPFVDQFKPSEEMLIRQTELLQRWLNNSNQPIGERQKLRPPADRWLEEFRAKVRAAVSRPESSNYSCISRVRSAAIEYIRTFEAHLNETLSYNAELAARSTAAARKHELLREPRLQFDLSAALRLANQFAPRRTARRPLRPIRTSSTQKPTVTLAFGADDPDAINRAVDLESQVLVQWQRFAAQRLGTNLQLVVTVQQATNLPMRTFQQATTRPNSPGLMSPSPIGLRLAGKPISPLAGSAQLSPPTTYVELTFQRKQQATSLAVGKNPSWNETLFFPVELAASPAPTNPLALADDRPSSAQTQLVDEFLQLNLYDYLCYPQGDSIGSSNEPIDLALNLPESTHPSVALPAHRVLTSRQRVERHLLGLLRIPLATLLSTGRIEGSLTLDHPLLLSNYQFEPELALNSRLMLSPELSADQLLNSDNSQRTNTQTRMNLFITLDPQLSMAEQLYLPVGSHESEQVFSYARLWEQLLRRPSSKYSTNRTRAGNQSARVSRKIHSTRHVKALVLQRDTKYCIVSRLLTPLEPPRELLANKSRLSDRMSTLARFVSLLSPVKYGLFNMRQLAANLWFDSSQLINEALGGPEEKAILLCSYFLHLGRCSAVLLADSVPEGRCAYVIGWQEQSRLLDERLRSPIDDLMASENSNLNQESNAAVGRDEFLSRLPILISPKCVQLWDPNSGRCYSLAEQLQLVSIGSIITIENVYANIQSVDGPHETNFDIRLRQHWMPLFAANAVSSSSTNPDASRQMMSSKRLGQMGWRRQLAHLEMLRRSIGWPTMPPLIQRTTKFRYETFSDAQCEELKLDIERAIKSHLLKLRPNRPTYFNRTLARMLSDKLALFEDYMSAPDAQQKYLWSLELANLIKSELLEPRVSSSGLQSRQVISWPVNLPFTGMKVILDALFASGVHNADLALDDITLRASTGTQFIVACHVHAYPARTMSVWLYVAAVVSNNRDSQQFLLDCKL